MDEKKNTFLELEKIRQKEENQRGKIKIVLINTPLDFYESNSNPKYDTIFPFGLIALSEIAKLKGLGSIVVDGEASRLSVDEIVAYIKRVDPDIVGINLLSPTIDIAKEILSRVAQENRIIVGGGPHATFEPQNCFERMKTLDYVFCGEAIYSWNDFLECIIKGRIDKISSIQGITNRGELKIDFGKRVLDLEEIPKIDRSSIIYPYYNRQNRNETSIYASIGCSEKCRYCAGRAFSRGFVRYRAIESLVDEIESCVENNITAFHFEDDNFLQKADYVKMFRDELKRRGLNIKWRSFARVDSINSEMLDLVKESGCCRLTFGIESGSDSTLIKMNKGHNVTDALRALSLCEKYSIETKSFFMIGYPDEDEGDINATINFAADSSLSWAYFYLVRAFPGTYLFDQLIRNGYTKNELLKYIHWTPRIERGLSKDEIRIKKVLEDKNIFNIDNVLKYNVAHPRSINSYLSNDALMELMVKGYQKFYYRDEFLLHAEEKEKNHGRED